MQCVAPLEQLQVARAQHELADEPLAPAQQIRAHVVEALVLGGADVRAVLEDATVLGLLGEQADGELVGVEVPRMLPARPDHVEHQPGQRIGQLVEPVELEAVGNEPLEGRTGVEAVDDGRRLDPVARHERVAPLHRDVAGVVGRPRRIGVGVVDVHDLDSVVRVRRGPLALAAQRVEALGPDEPGQHAAADIGQIATGSLDHGAPRVTARIGQRIPVRVNDIGDGHPQMMARPGGTRESSTVDGPQPSTSYGVPLTTSWHYVDSCADPRGRRRTSHQPMPSAAARTAPTGMPTASLAHRGHGPRSTGPGSTTVAVPSRPDASCTAETSAPVSASVVAALPSTGIAVRCTPSQITTESPRQPTNEADGVSGMSAGTLPGRPSTETNRSARVCRCMPPCPSGRGSERIIASRCPSGDQAADPAMRMSSSTVMNVCPGGSDPNIVISLVVADRRNAVSWTASRDPSGEKATAETFPARGSSSPVTTSEMVSGPTPLSCVVVT